MTTLLQKKIMRRVYYAYAIRLATTPGVAQGFLMLAVLIGLTRFVSLGNVVRNFMSIEVGHAGTFFYNAVTNTEAWTLLLLGVFIYAAFSLRFKVAPLRTHSFVKA